MKRKKETGLIVIGVLFMAFAGVILWLQFKNNTSVAPLMYTMAAADGIFGIIMMISGLRGSEDNTVSDDIFENKSAPVLNDDYKDDTLADFDKDTAVSDDNFFDDDFGEPEEYKNDDFTDLLEQTRERVKKAKKNYDRAFNNASERLLDLEDAQDNYERDGGSDEATYELSRAKRAAKKADDEVKAASQELKEAKKELKRLEALEK